MEKGVNESTESKSSALIAHREQYFLLGLLAVCLYGAYRVMAPYVHVLIVAAVIASLSAPLYGWFLRRLKGRENLAALSTVATVGLLVVAPLAGFAVALASKAQRSFVAVQEWIASGKLKALLESEQLARLTASAPAQKALAFRETYLPELDKASVLQKGAEFAGVAANAVGSNVGSLVGNLLGLVVSFMLVLFTTFYFLRDGRKILSFVMKVSPMSEEHEARLLKRAQDVSRSAIVGTGLTAAAQAVLGMVGFAIAGIEWFFWGVMLGVASLIPVVGTALVWIPATIFLLATGHVGMAIFLAIYCIAVVGSADNFLRPFLMEGDTGLSSLMVFFSILGGIQLFGLIGVLYGPLIFGLCAVLLYIYEMEVDAATAKPAKRRRNRRRKPKPHAQSESDAQST